jgi:hypothetical protein
MKYWEIIADNLSKAGWSWGCVATVDANGRTTFVADAHRDDNQRFVVHADEKLTAFLELERVTRESFRFSEPLRQAPASSKGKRPSRSLPSATVSWYYDRRTDQERLRRQPVQGPNGGSYGSSLYAACGLVRRSAGHAALQSLAAELVRFELD